MAAQPQRPDPSPSELEGIPDPKGHPIIPNLGNFTAGIFAPIPESETFADPAGAATRLDGLQRKLQAMDAHAVANRNNYLDLCARERERIKQEGRRFEALAQRMGQPPPDATRPGTLHAMIANMEAEPLPGAEAEVESRKSIPRPQFLNDPRPLRERQAIQLLDFAGFAADLAEAREADLAKRREALEAEIRAEQEKESQARMAE